MTIQSTKPIVISNTTGFFCPMCGRAILPHMRLSYPPDAIGKFAPVYRCGCGRHVGEPVRVAVTGDRRT